MKIYLAKTQRREAKLALFTVVHDRMRLLGYGRSRMRAGPGGRAWNYHVLKTDESSILANSIKAIQYIFWYDMDMIGAGDSW